MKTPFIQLFSTPNSNYFLDVNKNEFIPISKPSFQYLSALMSGKGDCEAPVPQGFASIIISKPYGGNAAFRNTVALSGTEAPPLYER